MNQNHLPPNKSLRKVKLPLKIKIFMWFLVKGVVLIKDNLIKKIGNVMTNVVFATRKPSSIYFFIVIVQCKLFMAYNSQLVHPIYLEIGYREWIQTGTSIFGWELVQYAK